MGIPNPPPLRHSYVSYGFEFVWMKGRDTVYVRKVGEENFFYGFKPRTVSGTTPRFSVLAFHRAIMVHNEAIARAESKRINYRAAKNKAGGNYIVRWHQVLARKARDVYGDTATRQ